MRHRQEIILLSSNNPKSPEIIDGKMKLPNVQSATVPERKLTHYLLNPAHVAGGSKARFFLRFGFTVAEWRQMAEALLRHARENEVADMEQTARGTRYVVDGLLAAPDGSLLNIRSAWYIDLRGDGGPRFVTAHPLPKL
jgi:hypothetical protein